MNSNLLASSPRESGEKKGTQCFCIGGEEGLPDTLVMSCHGRPPVAPLLSHRFAAGPFPLPSEEGRGRTAQLPMDFMAETQKLSGLSLEGSVG